MKQYVAVSTVNEQVAGWEVLAAGSVGESRSQVEDQALAEIDRQYPSRTDIYNDTLRKNLHVLPLSRIERERRFEVALERYYYNAQFPQS